MSFPRYDSYKDSGFEWLGKVPKHWAVERLKHIAQLNPSKSEVAALPDATELSFLPMEAIGEDGSLDLSRTRPVAEVRSGYSYFADGDVAFAKVTPCLENGKGALIRGLKGGRGFGTTELTVLRPLDHANAEFLWWITASQVFRGPAEGEMVGAGGLKRVPDEFVADFRIGWPPQPERAAIISFLNRETAKIDALVEAQQRLIELLKEKRQAVISHAVTKGLDPATPMKDSGLEWLGQVPAHWTITRLKRLSLSFCDGPFGSALKSEHYVDDGVRVLRLQNIKTNNFDGSDAVFIDRGYFDEELVRHSVQSGDILLAGLGDERNTVGRSCVAPDDIGPAMVKADCFRFRMRSPANPYFVSHQLSAGAMFAAGVMSSGSTRSRIPLSVMANRIVALPGTEEQAHIVRYVSALSARFDKLSAEAEFSIALLRERRAALISAAVTGKIDVRGLAAAPQEAEAA